MIKSEALFFPFLFFTLSALFLAGCGVYNNGFQCPAGKGVGCKAVGEVLELIVEKEEGEDLFIPDKGKVLLLKKEESKKTKTSKEKSTAQADQKPLTLVKAKSGELILVTEEETSQGYDATTKPSRTETR